MVTSWVGHKSFYIVPHAVDFHGSDEEGPWSFCYDELLCFCVNRSTFVRIGFNTTEVEELVNTLVGVERTVSGVTKLGAVEQSVDRKSTRLNSSHVRISYAVFCL